MLQGKIIHSCYLLRVRYTNSHGSLTGAPILLRREGIHVHFFYIDKLFLGGFACLTHLQREEGILVLHQIKIYCTCYIWGHPVAMVTRQKINFRAKNDRFLNRITIFPGGLSPLHIA